MTRLSPAQHHDLAEAYLARARRLAEENETGGMLMEPAARAIEMATAIAQVHATLACAGTPAEEAE